MLSPQIENALGVAVTKAQDLRHEFVTIEHLLYALLDIESVNAIVSHLGGSVDKLRGDLDRFLGEQMPLLEVDDEIETQPGIGFQRVLRRAILHVQNSGKEEVQGANVLISILSEKDSHAAYYLNAQNITRFDVVSHISHGVMDVAGDPQLEYQHSDEDPDGGQADAQTALGAYTVNLNELAISGKIASQNID